MNFNRRQMRSAFIWTVLIVITQTLLSCMLKDDVDIEFPDVESQMMLECYLCPEENYELTFMETNKLSEDLILQLNWNADITIRSYHDTISLFNILNIEKETGYVFNYGTPSIVPNNESGTYYLDVVTESGIKITAQTNIVSPVKISEIQLKDKNLSVLFTADTDSAQRYYSLLVEGYLDGEYTKVRDYINASKTNENEITYSVKASFYKWESIKVKLFHITMDNYHFQMSAKNALVANMDPFSVPEEIKSNVSGAKGIFTYFTVDSLQIK
ncbi:DUF4249 family protein [Labilibaculum manganireducens]|uniref:DUF4249 family protein n=1 Tax=Labilibaculum manganireducens TaxID=1940525 RepID=UPI0029F527D0|nr:DUF4249 family protein [Labilibaculum manganireducens]